MITKDEFYKFVDSFNGKYDELEGKYFQQTWTPDSKAIETCPGGCGHSELKVRAAAETAARLI